MSPKANETALQTVPPAANSLNPILGTALEKVEAFRQISANISASGLEINGWKEAKEVLAACWLADGLLVNPIMFMQGNWVMPIGGKKVIEPKWDFVVALLQSRVPGFRWKVLQETETVAEVWMADGFGNEHTVTYTIEDAKRQGHFARNPLYKTSSREMLLAKAVKRCGKRIGASALAGMASFEPEYEVQENGRAPLPPKGTAEVLDEIATEGEKKPEDAKGARTALAEAILKHWGKQAPAKALETINAIAREALPDAPQFAKVGDIGPADARLMTAHVEKRFASKQAGEGESGKAAPKGAVAETGSAGADPPEPSAAASTGQACSFPDCQSEATSLVGEKTWCDEHAPVEDPPLDDEPEPELSLEQVGAAAEADQDGRIETLVMLLDKAGESERFTRRALYREAKAGKWWITNQEMAKAHGFSGAVLIYEVVNGAKEQRVEPEMCRRFCVWLRSQGIA